MPFYDHPLEHTGNMLTGAAAGAVVGLGLVIYDSLTGSSDSDKFRELSDQPISDERQRLALSRMYYKTSNREKTGSIPVTESGLTLNRSLWMPLVSVTW